MEYKLNVLHFPIILALYDNITQLKIVVNQHESSLKIVYTKECVVYLVASYRHKQLSSSFASNSLNYIHTG